MTMIVTAERPALPVSPVGFTGRNGDFRRLVTRGALLELVTFGFYRFWLTTDIRRHLWSHTEIDGDALEYTGRGRELLFGFLVAMAVLGPIFLGYFLLGLEAERYKAFASLPLYILMFAFGQFAAYRARRYRLTRTIWRGVRFWMTGSGWSYAWRSMLWGLLLFPTLGLAYPWRMAALERFKLRHTLYGNLPGRFEATGGQLFREVWWIWLLGVTPFVMMAAGGGVAAALGGKKPAGPAIIAAGIIIIAASLLMVGLPFLHAARRAREWRWWVGGIRFGSVTVACDLRTAGLIGVYWTLIGMAVVFLLVYAVVIGGVAAVLQFGTQGAGWLQHGNWPVWGVVAFAVSYLILLVALGVLARIYILQRVWRRVVAACSVAHLDGASDVAAAGNIVSAFGEGLLDGLDFGL